MMLAFLEPIGEQQRLANNGPADAHDAGQFGADWRITVQLMFMMLAVPGHVVKSSRADAHDAGQFGADWQRMVQLMLMMLAVSGPFGEEQSS